MHSWSCFRKRESERRTALTLRFWVSQITAGHGEFIVFIPASQVQLVNARWFARFPTGVLPSNTVLLATCGR